MGPSRPGPALARGAPRPPDRPVRRARRPPRRGRPRLLPPRAFLGDGRGPRHGGRLPQVREPLAVRAGPRDRTASQLVRRRTRDPVVPVLPGGPRGRPRGRGPGHRGPAGRVFRAVSGRHVFRERGLRLPGPPRGLPPGRAVRVEADGGVRGVGHGPRKPPVLLLAVCDLVLARGLGARGRGLLPALGGDPGRPARPAVGRFRAPVRPRGPDAGAEPRPRSDPRGGVGHRRGPRSARRGRPGREAVAPGGPRIRGRDGRRVPASTPGLASLLRVHDPSPPAFLVHALGRPVRLGGPLLVAERAVPVEPPAVPVRRGPGDPRATGRARGPRRAWGVRVAGGRQRQRVALVGRVLVRPAAVPGDHDLVRPRDGRGLPGAVRRAAASGRGAPGRGIARRARCRRGVRPERHPVVACQDAPLADRGACPDARRVWRAAPDAPRPAGIGDRESLLVSGPPLLLGPVRPSPPVRSTGWWAGTSRTGIPWDPERRGRSCGCPTLRPVRS